MFLCGLQIHPNFTKQDSVKLDCHSNYAHTTHKNSGDVSKGTAIKLHYSVDLMAQFQHIQIAKNYALELSSSQDNTCCYFQCLIRGIIFQDIPPKIFLLFLQLT